MRPPLRTALALTVWLLAASPVTAGRVVEVEPYRADGWLHVDVHTADLLDPRTRSTVESGLPGHCRLRLELRDARDEVAVRRVIERVLAFDLWEGIARVREGASERAFRSIDAADSAWSHFAGLRLLPWERVDLDGRYRLHVQVRVEPFGPEERERVSEYVSENERGDRRELAFDLGGLVGRLVGRGGTDDDAPVWTSPPFRPASLPERAP